MIRKLLVISFVLVFTVSCSTVKPSPMVPDLPSDSSLFDSLIEEPETELDLLNNLTVFEFLYVNQKIQTYNLMVYICQLTGDNAKQRIYEDKILNIKEIYGIKEPDSID